MQARAEELKTYDLIDHPDFSNRRRRRDFMQDMEGFHDLVSIARSRGVDITSMCSMPLLTKAQEQHLFRQFNALKYAINCAVKDRQVARYWRLVAKMQEVKDVLFMSNVRLVVNFLKKKGLSPDVFMLRFSDACEFLAHALDKFNFAFGFKFSTYGTWALIKNFSNQNKAAKKQERMHYIDSDTFLECYDIPAQMEEPGSAANHQEYMDYLFFLANLDEREAKAILAVGGLNDGGKKTLQEVGEEMHVSKERVRQIKVSGTKKLRAILRRNAGLMEAM